MARRPTDQKKMKGCDIMDRNLKRIILLVFNIVGFTILLKIGQFNVYSYLFGMCSVYMSRWCYRG